MSDPYEILGVQRGASEEEIKKKLVESLEDKDKVYIKDSNL